MNQPYTIPEGRYPFVLSGGGARGYAHLGVLKAFEERNIFPEAIAATSSGSIIAAFICDGYSADEAYAIARQNKMELSMQLKNWPAGIMSLKSVEDLLKRYLRSTTFEQMRLPFHITATNFQNGQRAVFSKGPVIPAILAASSIPILLPPVEIEGIPYVDGGLSGNLPVEPLLPDYEQIIGVHVNPIAPWNAAAGIRANVERTLNMAINAPVAASAGLCTWYIEPRALLEYRVFDFKKFEAIYNIGLEYTRGLLQTAPV